MKCLPFLFLGLLLHFTQSINSQQPYFRHYGVEQGVSSNQIVCTLQDKFGFLWVGTQDGLNRFDGYQFKIYRHIPGDPHSIGSSNIQSLKLDQNGNLLIGTDKGLYQFDSRTETFQQLVAQPPGNTSHLSIDHAGNVWYVSGQRLKRYNPANRSLRIFWYKQLPQVTAVCVAADGSVWAATIAGKIYRYQPETDKFIPFDLFAHSRKASSTRISSLYPTKDTALLVGTTNQGVKQFFIKTGTYQDLLAYSPEQTELYVRGFTQSGPDEYWIATETGIYIYNLKTNKYQHLRKGFSNPYSLSDNAVYTLCKDREGGIWAGTNFGGLNYYQSQNTPFRRFYPGNTEQAISGNLVHDITADRLGNIWIGTEDAGLNKWNPATGKVTYYQPAVAPGSLTYSNVHGLLAVGNELWVGTYEHGLDVLDIRTGKLLRHYISGNNPNQFRSNFIVTLYLTRNSDILVGTWNGLYRYRRETDDFELYKNFKGQVQSVKEAQDGTLWICTLDNGVFYTKQDGTWGSLKFRDGAANTIANNTVHGQFHDQNGIIWFATETGLCRYDVSTGRFKTYTTKEGLPANVVYRVEEDKQNRLWISTINGLACMDPQSEQIRTYTTANGLLSNHFNFNSSYRDTITGRLYFGSLKGMVAFDPSEFVTPTNKPPLYFTNIQVKNRKGEDLNPRLDGPELLNNDRELELRHFQSTLSVDFAALSFTTPEKTKYRYKLEGLEQEWTVLNTVRRLYFSSLRPGSYKLRVQVLPETGNEPLNEKSLAITILPPWWASHLAYALYFLFAIVSGWTFLRFYHRRTKEKALRKIELMALKKEKELYEAKMDFFTQVAHEIRTPLTLIKGPLERVIQKTKDRPELRNSLGIMERNTERLISLTSQLLDFRKAETNGFKMHLEETNISEVLTEHFNNAQASVTGTKLNCLLQLPAEQVFAPADMEALDKILSNLLSNAVKYAANNIIVRIEPPSTSGEHVTISFENDGAMIPEVMREKIFEPFFRLHESSKVPGSGVGLALARSLAELHGGKLVLVPDEQYNVFKLTLPAHHQDSAMVKQENFEVKPQVFP